MMDHLDSGFNHDLFGVLKDIGFDQWEYQVVSEPSGSIFISLVKKVDGADFRSKSKTDLIQLIVADIFNSKFIQRQYEITDKMIAGKAEEIQRLKNEIQDLTAYKTHYDLEMQLRHGTKEPPIQFQYG